MDFGKLLKTGVSLGIWLGVLFGISYAVAKAAGEDKGSLDRAQANFEGDFAHGRGYNWPWFHQRRFGLQLDCRDPSAHLRICDVRMPTMAPDGSYGPLHEETFVCSRYECAWAVLQP